MNIAEIKETLHYPDYAFLKDNDNLNKNIILLGLGGSHAYGTNTPDSDLDIRGIATNRIKNILTGQDFEQVVDVPTDTVIYSVEKMFKLLAACNPNTIEILGLKPDHYLYLSDAGKLLLENKNLFLSQIAIYSFAGYATSQLRRMENKAARVADQPAQEFNILKSIEKSMFDLERRHFPLEASALNLYLDTAVNSEFEEEIFIDLNLKHYPLRDYANLHAEMLNIIRTYNKNTHRNNNAISHDKLGKHMMHLIRLYLMCLDIVEKQEIITYREADLELLNSIRRGDFLDENTQPIPEFYDMLNDYEKRLDYAAKNTSLPRCADQKAINELLYTINADIVKRGLIE